MSVARDILAELRRHGVLLMSVGDRLRLRALTAPPTELLDRLRRHKAEIHALLSIAPTVRPVVHFRLPEHPTNACATAIGSFGESREELIADLRQRWPAVEVW